MSDKKYIIDGDQHLAELAGQTVPEMEEMFWKLDVEGALIYPDEYALLREELDHYLSKPTTDLQDWELRRVERLKPFFAMHPNPPPAPPGYEPLP